MLTKKRPPAVTGEALKKKVLHPFYSAANTTTQELRARIRCAPLRARAGHGAGSSPASAFEGGPAR